MALPTIHAAKPRVFNVAFKDFFHAHLRSRSCRFLEVIEIWKGKSLSYDNAGKQNVPTELRCVKKINGVSVKKALVPWDESVSETKDWHFNAFSERNWFLAEQVRRWLFFGSFLLPPKEMNRIEYGFCKIKVDNSEILVTRNIYFVSSRNTRNSYSVGIFL